MSRIGVQNDVSSVDIVDCYVLSHNLHTSPGEIYICFLKLSIYLNVCLLSSYYL